MRLLHRTFPADQTAPAAAHLWETVAPGFWTVQAGCAPPPAHSPSRLLGGFAADDGMALTLRTDTLLECNVGAMLGDRLNTLHCGIGELAGLALHEILVNAAVHGNLQVASRPTAVWREREAHARQIEEGLANPCLAGRMVTIALGWHATRLCASIIDEGRGYALPPVREPPIAARQAAGRGLSIARAAARVKVLRGGTCTRMIFERAPAPGTD